MTGFIGVEVPTAYDLYVPDPPPATGLPGVVHNYDISQVAAGPGDALSVWSDFSDTPDPMLSSGASVANSTATGNYVTVPPGAQLTGGVKRLVPRTVVILMRTSLLNVYVASICGFRIRRSTAGAYQLVSPNPPSGGGAKIITGAGGTANTSNWVILAVSLAADGSALLNVGGTDAVIAAGAFDVGTSNFTTPNFVVDSAQTSGVDTLGMFERAATSTSAEIAAMRTTQKARRSGVFT